MRIKELVLFAKNIPELAQFYGNVLECTVHSTQDSFTISTVETNLRFKHGEGIKATYHIAFTIPWNQVDAAAEWVATKVPLLPLAAQQVIAEFNNWSARAFYFLDPAGNIVEFIGRKLLGIESNLPFNGRSLLSISEIGIVTDNVPLACRQLTELWNIQAFSCQPATPNFAALGDHHGLLIIVSEGRNWYPTDVPAAKAPLSILFEDDDGAQRRLEIE